MAQPRRGHVRAGDTSTYTVFDFIEPCYKLNAERRGEPAPLFKLSAAARHDASRGRGRVWNKFCRAGLGGGLLPPEPRGRGQKPRASPKSIRNQRELLLNWAQAHGYRVYRVYIDEDYRH